MKKNIKTIMTRSENMAKIKSKDTSIEMLLRKELWAHGVRYRVNDKAVFGKPDISFRMEKIAIFCDSEFWHGKDYIEGKCRIKTNSDYWNLKLKRNINRDKKVNQTLNEEGWTVLRFWANDIKKGLPRVIKKILLVL